MERLFLDFSVEKLGSWKAASSIVSNACSPEQIWWRGSEENQLGRESGSASERKCAAVDHILRRGSAGYCANVTPNSLRAGSRVDAELRVQARRTTVDEAVPSH